MSWLLQIVPSFPWVRGKSVSSSRAVLGWLNLLACALAVARTVLPGSGAGLGLRGASGCSVALVFRLPTLLVGIFPATAFPGLRVFSELRR